jgi:hypothetical protein
MDRETHARFLEYRDRHTYFGKGAALDMAAFAKADLELRELERKAASRDDEEEARYADLVALLLLD